MIDTEAYEQCFKCAWDLIFKMHLEDIDDAKDGHDMRHEGAMLVHAIVHNDGNKYAHAWVEDNGIVWQNADQPCPIAEPWNPLWPWQ